MYTLYQHFDSDNQLLYVGSTDNIQRRNAEHKRYKVWWEDVHHTLLSYYETLNDVRQAEQICILEEAPKYNIQTNVFKRNHTPTRHSEETKTGKSRALIKEFMAKLGQAGAESALITKLVREQIDVSPKTIQRAAVDLGIVSMPNRTCNGKVLSWIWFPPKKWADE